MLVSANKKSPSRIQSFLAYLEASFVLTILEVIRAEVSTFEYGANIDILVSEPSCAVGDGLDIDLFGGSAAAVFVFFSSKSPALSAMQAEFDGVECARNLTARPKSKFFLKRRERW